MSCWILTESVQHFNMDPVKKFCLLVLMLFWFHSSQFFISSSSLSFFLILLCALCAERSQICFVGLGLSCVKLTKS